MDKSPIALQPFRLLRILPTSKERHEPIDDFIRRTPGSLVTLRLLARAGAVESRDCSPSRRAAGVGILYRRSLLGDCVLLQLADAELDYLDALEEAAEQPARRRAPGQDRRPRQLRRRQGQNQRRPNGRLRPRPPPGAKPLIKETP